MSASHFSFIALREGSLSTSNRILLMSEEHTALTKMKLLTDGQHTTSKSSRIVSRTHLSGRTQAAKLIVCFCIVRDFEGEDSVEKIAFCLVLHGCKIVIE